MYNKAKGAKTIVDNIASRGITMSVRPPRFALLVDNRNAGLMHSYIRGAVGYFSQCWGGDSYLIIPTDGRTIDESFWRILTAYSPDVIGRYIPSLPGLEQAKPDEYNRIKEQNRQSLQLEEDEFETYWVSQAGSQPMINFDISDSLSEELIKRINPFYFDGHVVSENIYRNGAPSYPLTKITSIAHLAKSPPAHVFSIKPASDKYLDLMLLSLSGSVSTRFTDELSSNGIQTFEHEFLNAASDTDRISAIIDAKFGASNSGYYQSLEHPLNLSFASLLPSSVSMIALSYYYQTGIHFDHKEPIRVVVGDTMDDYCLFYNLARLHSGVFWIPDRFLRDAHRRTTTDDEHFSDSEGLASHIVNVLNSQIRYGQSEKYVELTSYSLTKRQLGYRKRWMGEICLLDSHSFLPKVHITVLAKLSLDCITNVIETNNHRNIQDMIFQDGKGINRLSTPRPKNFTDINPLEHRWITTCEIDGFSPPPIPELISQILDGLSLTTHEARISRGNIAYFCPSSIIWSGYDTDSTLVYPRINLLSDRDLVASFFNAFGYKIETSDKGSYLSDIVRRFGSLDAVGAFFSKGENRSLFDKYLLSKQAAQEFPQEIVHLSNEKQNNNYLSFDVIVAVTGDVDKAIKLVDYLIAIEIVQRELILQCSRCRRACWYDIADLSTAFTCKRCGYSQIYSYSNWKSPSQPQWYFKLVETAYLFYESSSHLTALALCKLKSESKRSFHFAFETDITSPDGIKNEIDIIAITDGKVVIGECKNCQPSPSDIRKYTSLFQNLSTKPDGFILATSAYSVSPDVKVLVSSLTSSKIYIKADILPS